MKKIEMIGRKYGLITVISEYYSPKETRYVWGSCECDGNIKRYRAWRLRKGITKSCGCHQSKTSSERLKDHGLSRHPLYITWNNIKCRCYKEDAINYDDYGGRGIKVCGEWSDFMPFYNWCVENGWQEGLQIDRRNNDGDYTPDNCRFVDQMINKQNQRLIKSTNSSGYRGVYFNKGQGSYAAQIQYKKKYVLSKCGFHTAKEAAIDRDIYCIKNDIPFALNFPELLYWVAL